MPTALLSLAACLLAAHTAFAVRYRIDTFAGSGDPGSATDVGDGLPATAASLDHPAGLVRDARGDVYIADHNHARVRRVRASRRRRVMTTVAGTGEQGFGGDGGRATEARLTLPTGLAFTRRRELLVVDAGSEQSGNTVRRIDAKGIIHTLAGVGDAPAGDSGDGGRADAAQLNTPLRAVVARNGDVYIVELNNNRVRRVRASDGIIYPVAGTGLAGDAGDEGPAVDALLDQPAGLALGAHATLYIADFGNDRIRVVGADGIIHALAGTGVRTGSVDGEGGDPSDDLHDDGPASAATFFKPTGIAFDRQGDLLVADQGNNRIRRIARDETGVLSPASIVTTIVGNGVGAFAGDGGDARAASLLIPTDVLPLPRGRLLVADRGNDRVRVVVPVSDTTLCSASCDDGNPCTVDACDPTTGCSHVAAPVCP
jgi:hypothetical protein